LKKVAYGCACFLAGLLVSGGGLFVYLRRSRPELAKDLETKVADQVRDAANGLIPQSMPAVAPGTKSGKPDETPTQYPESGDGTRTSELEQSVGKRERDKDTRLFLEELGRILKSKSRGRVTKVDKVFYNKTRQSVIVNLLVTRIEREGDEERPFIEQHAMDVMDVYRGVYDTYEQGVRLTTVKSYLAGKDSPSAAGDCVFTSYCSIFIFRKIDFEKTGWREIMRTAKAKYLKGFPQETAERGKKSSDPEPGQPAPR